MRRDEETHEFEARILWKGEKSWLVETTIPLIDGHHKFFIPKNSIYDHNESDGDGHFMFLVGDWWWQKMQRGDFQADE